MNTTLTIRLPKAQRAALRRRALAEKRTESSLVREMIDREMNHGFDFERVQHLAGAVEIDRKKIPRESWAAQIRRNNWRK